MAPPVTICNGTAEQCRPSQSLPATLPHAANQEQHLRAPSSRLFTVARVGDHEGSTLPVKRSPPTDAVRTLQKISAAPPTMNVTGSGLNGASGPIGARYRNHAFWVFREPFKPRLRAIQEPFKFRLHPNAINGLSLWHTRYPSPLRVMFFRLLYHCLAAGLLTLRARWARAAGVSVR
jgi:hypothetical protein